MSDFSNENCRILWREVEFPRKVGSHGVVRAKIRTVGRLDGHRECRALFGEVRFPGKVGADILTFINFSKQHYNSRVDGAYTLLFEIYILECVWSHPGATGGAYTLLLWMCLRGRGTHYYWETYTFTHYHVYALLVRGAYTLRSIIVNVPLPIRESIHIYIFKNRRYNVYAPSRGRSYILSFPGRMGYTHYYCDPSPRRYTLLLFSNIHNIMCMLPPRAGIHIIIPGGGGL